jgi:hypothetical protein
MTTATDTIASERQMAYVHSLLEGRDQQAMTADQKVTWAKIEAASDHPLTARLASKAIGLLQAMPAKTVAPKPTDIDLSSLPDGRYGVPGSGTWHTRLKVLIERGKPNSEWAGVIFVKDAAEYGYGKRYGRQNPGQKYQGDIAAELAQIVADPKGAAKRYGELTNRCCSCNRPLEDELSVARGVGPKCWEKYFA